MCGVGRHLPASDAVGAHGGSGGTGRRFTSCFAEFAPAAAAALAAVGAALDAAVDVRAGVLLADDDDDDDAECDDDVGDCPSYWSTKMGASGTGGSPFIVAKKAFFRTIDRLRYVYGSVLND